MIDILLHLFQHFINITPCFWLYNHEMVNKLSYSLLSNFQENLHYVLDICDTTGLYILDDDEEEIIDHRQGGGGK